MGTDAITEFVEEKVVDALRELLATDDMDKVREDAMIVAGAFVGGGSQPQKKFSAGGEKPALYPTATGSVRQAAFFGSNATIRPVVENRLLLSFASYVSSMPFS